MMTRLIASSTSVKPAWPHFVSMVKAPQQRNDEQAFTQSNKKKAAKFSPRGSLHRVMRTDLEGCTNLQLAHYVTLRTSRST
jgi:hypothetical protein